MTNLLELRDVHVSYGSRRAVHGVSMDVAPGEIVALVGANGAGKTSILRSIIGLNPPASGEVTFQGRPIHRMTPDQIVRQGIALSPEGRRVFPFMSIHENLLVGAYLQKDRQLIARTLERIFTVFPRLAERRAQAAGTLSGGEQQMLAMGRALMAQPRLLLLDEPSLGLAPLVVREIARVILETNRDSHTSIILVEQNANLALRLCHRAYVIESGLVALSGTGAELLKSPHVRQAYLGV